MDRFWKVFHFFLIILNFFWLVLGIFWGSWVFFFGGGGWDAWEGFGDFKGVLEGFGEFCQVLGGLEGFGYFGGGFGVHPNPSLLPAAVHGPGYGFGWIFWRGLGVVGAFWAFWGYFIFLVGGGLGRLWGFWSGLVVFLEGLGMFWRVWVFGRWGLGISKGSLEYLGWAWGCT